MLEGEEKLVYYFEEILVLFCFLATVSTMNLLSESKIPLIHKQISQRISPNMEK